MPQRDFFIKMKKKKPLQDILDNIDNVTVEFIEKSKQPKWIRDILIDIKNNGKRQTLTSREQAKIEADIMWENNINDISDKKYQVRQWTSFEQMIGDKFQIDIQRGDYILFEDGYFKINHNILYYKDIQNISNNSIFIDFLTNFEYTTIVNKLLNMKL